jgi:hypothetical protein
MAAAEAALRKRNKPDRTRRTLEWMVEEVDPLLDGDEVFPPAVFPAGCREKVVSARQLLIEALAALGS